MSFHLGQLRAFLAVVEHGSLGRAAQILHMTQPALSRAVARLEADVGTSLFERHSKGMQLTAVGQALLPHAQLLHREAEAAREEINAMRGLARGTIRVGTVGSSASSILPQAVSAVLRQWPWLRVSIIEGVWDRLADSLIRREIDLALAPAVSGTEDICNVPDCHWEDASHVVAAPGHPLRRKKKCSLRDTLQAQWAIPPRGTDPHEHMRQVFARQDLPMPDIAVETRSIITLKSLVTHSGFLSWMPSTLYESESRSGIFDTLPLPGIAGRRTLTIFRRRQGLLPSPAVKLLEQLRRSLVKRG